MIYDGSINIDTRVDTKGMNKGTKSISSSLGGVLRSVTAVAKAMAAVFIGGSIINGIRSLIGQFDLMGSSIGASVKNLSTAFQGLKSAFVSLLLTAFAPLIPYIITFVTWLARALATITQIISTLFGLKKVMAGVGNETKKASGALAAFDQINVLQKGDSTGGLALPDIQPLEGVLEKFMAFKDKFLDFIGPVVEAFRELLIVLAPYAKKFFDEFLVPLGNFVGSAFVSFLKFLTEKLLDLSAWIRENPEKFQTFLKILGIIAAVFGVIALTVWAVISAMTVLNAIAAVVTGVIAFLGGTMIVTGGMIALAIVGIILAFASMVLAVVGTISWFLYLKRILPEVWEAIKSAWSEAGMWFHGHVVNPIRNAFATMLLSISNNFITVFTGIRNFVLSVVNDIISIVNDAISGIVGGLLGATGNFGISLLNNKSDELVPRIPRLATGAVIPPNSQFLAVLGDQRSGKNIEAPEGLIRQIINDELGKITIETTFGFEGTLSGLVRELNPVILRENVRIGKSMVKGGTGK